MFSWRRKGSLRLGRSDEDAMLDVIQTSPPSTTPVISLLAADTSLIWVSQGALVLGSSAQPHKRKGRTPTASLAPCYFRRNVEFILNPGARQDQISGPAAVAEQAEAWKFVFRRLEVGFFWLCSKHVLKHFTKSCTTQWARDSSAICLLELTPISGTECHIGYGDIRYSKATCHIPKDSKLAMYLRHSAQLAQSHSSAPDKTPIQDTLSALSILSGV